MSGGREGGMAASKQQQQQQQAGDGNKQYWNEVHSVHDELSPVRKHLISTYLQVQDEEALPLLGEYFGVALSFMALGALVSASNHTKKRRKAATDEERLDLRACSRFQRMALESMLREAMERLKGLAQNAYQMEERVSEMVEAEVEMDKEKVGLLSRAAEAEKAVFELKGLRKAEGRANERVMSIVAGKEQDWFKEKKNLQKEIERLKENLNTVCREVKFQSRRCRNPTCEHCKGIERVVRNVRGRVSLRELNHREPPVNAKSPKREIIKVEPPPKVEEHEEERVLIKAMEYKKKRSGQPGHLLVQTKVEKHVEWVGTSSSVNPSGGSAGGAGQGINKEVIARQQQDMESELANILKRVGMLKQRSHSSGATSSSEQPKSSLESTRSTTSPEAKNVPLEGKDTPKVLEGSTPSSARVVPPHSKVVGQDLELADDLTTGMLSVEQEALLSAAEDPDLLELEKAFEFDEAMGTVEEPRAQVGNVSEEETQKDKKDAPAPIAAKSSEGGRNFDEDSEIAAFESCLSPEVEVSSLEEPHGEVGTSKDAQSEKVGASAPPPLDFDCDETMEVVEVVPPSEESQKGLGNEEQVLDLIEDDFMSLCGPMSHGLVEENFDEARMDVDCSAEAVAEVSPEPSETQDTVTESEKLDQSSSSEDASSSGEASPSGESSVSLGSPENPIVAMASVSCSSPNDSLEDDDILPAQESFDEDKAPAEQDKAVDAGEASDSEQEVEMVETDSIDGQSPSMASLNQMAMENENPLATDAEVFEDDDEVVTSVEETLVNAEIPLFERASSEDLAGELPEPDVKRVCGSGESDSFDESLTECTPETSDVQEKLKADESIISAEVESIADAPEMVYLDSLKKDVASFEDGKSNGVLVGVTAAVGGE